MCQIWKKSIHEKCVFGWLKVTFVKQCEKEEKGEEKGQYSGRHILWTTGPMSFKFGMYGCIYGGHQNEW